MKSLSSSSPLPHHTGSLNGVVASANYAQFTTPTKLSYKSSSSSQSSLLSTPNNGIAGCTGGAPLAVLSSPSSGNSMNHNQSNINNELAYCIVWSPLPVITWFIPFIGHTGICNSNGIASDFRGPYYVGNDGEMAFGQPTRALQIIMPNNTTNNNIINTIPTPTLRSSPRRSVNIERKPSLDENDNNRIDHHDDEVDDDDDNNDDVEYIENITNKDQNYYTSTISSIQWDAAIIEANEVYNHRMHNICCDNCHSHVAYALNLMNVHYYGIYKWDMIKIAILIFFRGRFISYTSILQQFGPFTILICIIIFINKM